MTTLLEHYHTLCQAEHLQDDPAQIAVIHKLENLSRSLRKKKPWWQILHKNYPPVTGLYIYGHVGRGKSMLMDLFYQHLDGVPKQRYHFHEFMEMIHGEMKKIMAMAPGKAITHHPMAHIAEQLAAKSQLICFDEFHIKDITDAMLLKRLMDFLWHENVVIVTTSNFPPQDLYQDGYQRQLVMPFLEKIGHHLELYNLEGVRDYRHVFSNTTERYFLTPPGTDELPLPRLFDALRGSAPIEQQILSLQKREWILEKVAGGIAYIEFDEICGQPLSAPDYLALTQQIHTVLIAQIPLLDDDSLDRVKRFITLIDVLYDQKINFSASGMGPLKTLYTGKKEKDLFERTLSRLTEMTSIDPKRKPSQPSIPSIPQ